MKLILTICLISITYCSTAQTICDSMSVAPNTVYLNQLTDSTAFFTFTYTGANSTGYSILSFEFTDTSDMNITEYVSTTGSIGPATFSWTYPIVYNNPSIPANTIVNCSFKVYHSVLSIDCAMPITFVINQTIGINETENPLNLTIFPNPFKYGFNVDLSTFQITTPLSLSIYSVDGRRVYSDIISNKFTDVISLYNEQINQLKPGIYFIDISSKDCFKMIKVIKE